MPTFVLYTFNYYHFHDNLPYSLIFFPSDLFWKTLESLLLSFVHYSLLLNEICTILRVCSYLHSYLHSHSPTFECSLLSKHSWFSIGFPRLCGENRSIFTQIEFHSKQDNKRSMVHQIVSLVLSLHIDGSLFPFPLMRCFCFPFFSHFIFHSFLFAAQIPTHIHSATWMRDYVIRAARSHMFSSAIYRRSYKSPWSKPIFGACVHRNSFSLCCCYCWRFLHCGTSQLRAIRRMIYMCLPYSFL